MTWAKYWTLRDMDEIAQTILRWSGVGYSWVADDLTEAEQRAIRTLTQILELDSTVARTVAGLPWVVDGITVIERHAIESLRRATQADRAYAQMIASLPWVG